MKKLMKKLLVLMISVLGVTSCGVNGTGITSSENNQNTTSDKTSEEGSSGCSDGVCGGTALDLDAVNDYLLNDPTWLNMNSNGNKMTLIPFTHINGPKAEWNFFAFVNFEYNAGFYYKYQVTYLSCTCRSADVNYWQTAYVELSVPASGDVNDVKLRKLSFENDSEGHYIAGFWGDSGTNGHDINGSGITYEDIKTGFIPFLEGKTYAQISSYDNYEVTANGITTSYDDTVFGIDPEEFAADMAKKNGGEGVLFHGDHPVQLDDFNGASVSTNNILRMLIPLMEYHAANNI